MLRCRGSSKTSLARSKRTLCFAKLTRLFSSSHAIRIYILYVPFRIYCHLAIIVYVRIRIYNIFLIVSCLMCSNTSGAEQTS